MISERSAGRTHRTVALLLAGPVIYPIVDLLLGRLQVTALDDRPVWNLRRGDADEERKR